MLIYDTIVLLLATKNIQQNKYVELPSPLVDKCQPLFSWHCLTGNNSQHCAQLPVMKIWCDVSPRPYVFSICVLETLIIPHHYFRRI